MKCQRCKTANATGVVFALCDPCFDTFEQEIKRDDSNGKAVPTDQEIEYFNEPFIRRPN